MRRSLSIFLGTTAVMVALAGFTSSAYALGDPLCVGKPFGIAKADWYTEPLNAGNTVVDTKGSALICDTQIFDRTPSVRYPGAQTQFVKLEIAQPLGTQISAANQTTPQLDGLYVGKMSVSWLTWPLGGPTAAFLSSLPVTVTVDTRNIGDPMKPEACPAGVHACFLGVSAAIFGAWMWVTGAGTVQSPYVLTIGEFKHGFILPPDTPFGLSRVDDLLLCGRLGAWGGRSCGSGGDPVLVRSGPPPSPGCANGNGIYSLVALRRKRRPRLTPRLNVCGHRLTMTVPPAPPFP